MSAGHVSFVLLKEPRQIDPAAIAASYRSLFPGGALGTEVGDRVFTLRSSGSVSTYVADMPGPVPDGEAEGFAECSYGSILGAPHVGEHRFHVLLHSPCSKEDLIDSLPEHLRHTAAVAHALDAIGIYDGNAGATHLADFYIGALQEEPLPSYLITGLSLARESTDRASVLTRGLRRLGLQEFMVTMPIDDLDEGLSYLFDLVGYVVGRKAQFMDGETVGRTAEERIPVVCAPSPFDEKEQVVTLALHTLSDD